MNDAQPQSPFSRLRIGTRGSDLALWQARFIQARLAELGTESTLEIIKTRGDRIDDVPFSKLEGKGFFTKELEDAQLDGRVDLAVHSYKDLSSTMPAGLAVAALVGREDPRELLLIRPEAVDREREAAGEVLPVRAGARLGTSAARRQAQITDLRPDLKITDLRGNVPTRVNKLRDGRYEAILLAAAGIGRLELDCSELYVTALEVADFVPAPAQGMLAIQCRDEVPLREFLGRLESSAAAPAVRAERRLLERLDGGCQLPFGVNVHETADGYRLVVFWAVGDTRHEPLRFQLDGPDPQILADQAYGIITRTRDGEES